MRIYLGITLVLLGGIPGLSGCGTKNAPRSDQAQRQEELHQIWQLYKLHQDQKKRPPGKLADLRTYEVPFPDGYKALTAGQCVAVWGVDLAKKTAKDADTVLAYDKAAPTDGGLVLMKDGTTKTLSAQEFQAATKAKG